MKFTIQFKCGSAPITVEEETTTPDLKAVFDVMDQFSMLPDKCGKCDCTELRPQRRTAKGFTFYEVVCRSCNAIFQFGERKPENGGSLYPKGWDDPWDGGAQRDSPPQQHDAHKTDADGIPF